MISPALRAEAHARVRDLQRAMQRIDALGDDPDLIRLIATLLETHGLNYISYQRRALPREN